MISFRFHLVSLVAVFLALGLGVLTGTTVINRAIVAQLQDQTAQLEQQSAELREEVTALRGAVDRSSRFAEEAVPYLIDGQLAQREVVLLTEDGTDPDAIDGAQTGLTDARADVVALLALDGSLSQLTEGQRADLGEAIGVEADGEGADFAAQVASALADRLAFGPQPGAPDPLATLMDGGFVVNQGPPLDDADLRALRSDAFVVVGGGSAPEPSTTLIPLVEALAEAGTPVAAAEGVDSPQPFVEELRTGAAADAIATQDNVDELFGRVGLVLALDDLLDGSDPGHYGVKDGATSVIPPPP